MNDSFLQSLATQTEDLRGQGLFKQEIRLDEPAGVYFLEVETNQGSVVEKLLLM